MRVGVTAAASAGIALALLATSVRGQRASVQYLIATDQTGGASDAGQSRLQALDAWVSDATRAGGLQRQTEEGDVLVPGRRHERFAQFHRGVRVFGGDVVRQTTSGGQPVSVFGAVYPDIGIDVMPAIAPTDATVLLARAANGVVFQDSATELYVLPHDGAYDLTWSTRVFSNDNGHVYRVFIDALTGNLIWQYDDTQTQVAVDNTGRGLGAAGDPLKVQTERFSGGFRAVDSLTPGRNSTYDMGGDPLRTNRFLSGQQALTDSDVASDADNVWSDQGVVSAQAYASDTYRFYFTRFQRSGLNNLNVRFRLLENPVRVSDFPTLGSQFPDFFNNAFYSGNGFVTFGVGGPGNRNYAAGIDVVAHELSHGVTGYTSNLIYQNESGALNEAFSDMMGAAVEFENQQKGAGPARAEWLLGEDVRPSGQPIRSLQSPSSLGFPDHYSLKVTTTFDNGGVHTNSSIMNHAFYLAIEGGTHRLSGGRVEGVGWDNRLEIEKVIYRGFTAMLPSGATYSMARAATIQAARDLFGAGSRAERAMTQAWDAVGVN
jgi:thermolysin